MSLVLAKSLLSRLLRSKKLVIVGSKSANKRALHRKCARSIHSKSSLRSLKKNAVLQQGKLVLSLHRLPRRLASGPSTAPTNKVTSSSSPNSSSTASSDSSNTATAQDAIDLGRTEVLNPVDPRTRDYYYNYRQLSQKSVSSASHAYSSGSHRSASKSDTNAPVAEAADRRVRDYFYNFRSGSNRNNSVVPAVREILTKLMITLMNDAMGRGGQSALKKLLYSPLIWMVRTQYFPLFTGGTTMQQFQNTAKKFLASGVRFAIDNSTEEANSLKQYLENAQNRKDWIQLFATRMARHVECFPLKMTGIMRPQLLERMTQVIMNENPRGFDPTGHLTDEEKQELEEALERLSDVVSHAKAHNMKIWLDAEQYKRQPAMNFVARKVSSQFNQNGEIWVYNTYQMYLKDAPHWLEFDIEHARQQGQNIGVKLVRGAYLQYEKDLAQREGRSDPIQPSKKSTDDAYDEAVRYTMQLMNESKKPGADGTKVGVAVCTHNRRSIEQAVGAIKKLEIEDVAQKNVFFAQLKGMADNLTFALGVGGYNALKWVPFGEFDDVWPYLMRRLEENQDMLGGMATEREVYWDEIKRRLSKKE